MSDMGDQATRTELEAAVFRRLVDHLRARTDVQNIDLMIAGGFTVELGLGDGGVRGWACDLTKDYVEINGDYRS